MKCTGVATTFDLILETVSYVVRVNFGSSPVLSEANAAVAGRSTPASSIASRAGKVRCSVKSMTPADGDVICEVSIAGTATNVDKHRVSVRHEPWTVIFSNRPCTWPEMSGGSRVKRQESQSPHGGWFFVRHENVPCSVLVSGVRPPTHHPNGFGRERKRTSSTIANVSSAQ